MSAEAVRAWLEARYDEDEQVALGAINQGGRGKAGEGIWQQCDPVRSPGLIGDMAGGVVTYGASSDGSPNRYRAEHIVRHDPARVEREIAAKRRRLERHAPMGNGGCDWCHEYDGGQVTWPCPDIVDDAQAYADRGDFPAALRLP